MYIIDILCRLQKSFSILSFSLPIALFCGGGLSLVFSENANSGWLLKSSVGCVSELPLLCASFSPQPSIPWGRLAAAIRQGRGCPPGQPPPLTDESHRSAHALVSRLTFPKQLQRPHSRCIGDGELRRVLHAYTSNCCVLHSKKC